MMKQASLHSDRKSRDLVILPIVRFEVRFQKA